MKKRYSREGERERERARGREREREIERERAGEDKAKQDKTCHSRVISFLIHVVPRVSA